MDKVVNQTDIVRLLAALGADSRLEILELLRGRALCVGAISKKLAISQSAVSQHLRILKDAGLVKAQRKGSFIHYCVNAEAFDRISTFAKGFVVDHEHPCKSSDCQRRS